MKKSGRRERLPFCAVLLAGGRGTRFWPRSRTHTPKQLLDIAGQETMLRETLSRLRPLFLPQNVWVVTNARQSASVRRELHDVSPSHILAEPVGRSTAAAIGLAAVHLVHKHGDALMAVLPSDSYVTDTTGYRKLVRAAFHLARVPGNLVVFGIPPTRPETGYGYIELGASLPKMRKGKAFAVRRFTEKPTLPLARKYAASGKYLWNAGMFFWRASTFLENLSRFLPATHAALQDLAGTIGTTRYAASLRRLYPRLKNMSVDYAIMEPATRKDGKARVSVIPARVGWTDIGSWAALYELLAVKPGANVSAGAHLALDAEGNYFWSPKKFVAAVGVRDLVVVDTGDALLICARHRSQDVGKIVKWLEERNHFRLI